MMSAVLYVWSLNDHYVIKLQFFLQLIDLSANVVGDQTSQPYFAAWQTSHDANISSNDIYDAVIWSI